MQYIWIVPMALTLAVCACFLIYSSKYVPVSGSLPSDFRGARAPHRITPKSLIPLIIILAAYTPVAFWRLGTTETPQSFAGFKDGPLTLELTEKSPHKSVAIDLYCGLATGEYGIYASVDGANWEYVAMFEQKWTSVFKWHRVELTQFPENANYIQFVADNPNMELGEVYLYDIMNWASSDSSKTGSMKLAAANSESEKLIDEPGLDSNTQDWYNNSYFDEIYHPRTAYEFIKHVSPYETTHPPLGKIIMSLGIRAFGMNPFGWRFVGTLLGVLMLVPLYLFVQNMFGKPFVSTCAVVLFASDFMHYVQTRIGTIDTEAVFFILLMYYFMYRYYTLPEDAPLKKSALWLGLCGLSFGFGAATKWVVIYGGIGLAFLWAAKIYKIIKFARSQGSLTVRENLMNRIGALFGFSVVFFIAIPAVIYCFSYIPFALAKYGASVDGTFGGYLEMIWRNQDYMLSYHGRLVDTHPYSSPWYAWLIDFRPILYFQWVNPNGLEGTKSVFGAFTNPLTTWAGLGAMVFMVPLALKGDRKAQLIFVGWLAQLLPWIFISRIAFAYHYFPNVVFLILAIARIMDALPERKDKPERLNTLGRIGVSNIVTAGFTACTVLLFIMFFPALSGKTMSNGYSQLLCWFNRSYPFW